MNVKASDYRERHLTNTLAHQRTPAPVGYKYRTELTRDASTTLH
jgi:hypothetical protein